MDREAFLQNIADQLKRPRQTKPPERDVIGVPSFYREHPFGETSAVDQLERFQEEWTALGGEVDVIDHTGQANDVLQHLFAELRPQTVVTWARDVFHDWELDWLWAQKIVHSLTGTDDFMEKVIMADIGITTVQSAIANTGTILLHTTDQQPRAVSLLPAIHVALIRESQIVSRMGETFGPLKEAKGQALPSSVHFVSGPSRSSDIENDLSIGVHGPVTVRVIVVRGV